MDLDQLHCLSLLKIGAHFRSWHEVQHVVNLIKGCKCKQSNAIEMDTIFFVYSHEITRKFNSFLRWEN